MNNTIQKNRNTKRILMRHLWIGVPLGGRSKSSVLLLEAMSIMLATLVIIILCKGITWTFIHMMKHSTNFYRR